MVTTAGKLVAMIRAAGQGRAGGLMLGHNSSVSAGNLRATMMSWRDAHPDVEVECVEADRSVLLAGLDTGEIDIAILMGAAGHNGFRCEPAVERADARRTTRVASAELTATRDQTKGDADRAVAHIEKIGPVITPESLLRAFAMAARKKLRNGDGSFARDHGPRRRPAR